MTRTHRLISWLIERYPAEFRRAHGRELRDASEWTLAESPGPGTLARLAVNLAAGAIAQHAAEFASDVRYARRTLGRSKWFAACAIAFGIVKVFVDNGHLPALIKLGQALHRDVDTAGRIHFGCGILFKSSRLLPADSIVFHGANNIVVPLGKGNLQVLYPLLSA